MSVSGTGISVTDEAGTGWVIEPLQPGGASLSTGERVGNSLSPDGTWSQHAQVSTLQDVGGAFYFTAVRRADQSVAVSSWLPGDNSVSGNFSVTSSGLTETYGLTLATSPSATERTTLLGFTGVASLLPPDGVEVRY